MMEGVAQEAASLAGHLQLDNLCWIYDNNEITIEGSTSVAFSDDIATKFIGLGWNVTRVGDANDRQMLARAFRTFRAERARPTLIIVDSRIAYGAPTKEGTHGAHGEPLGVEEIRGTKRFYGWPEDATFLVPDGGLRALRCRDRRPRPGAARGMGRPVRRATRRSTPTWPTNCDRMQRRQLPDQLGRRHPHVPS